MRLIRLLIGLVLAVGVGAAPADAQRYPQRYPQDYVPPFTPYWAAPQLEVYPAIGPPGSRVEITGSKFHRGLQVFYGDRPMQILAVGNRAIVAVIPPGARGDDYIYVTDITGRARTKLPFAVERPPLRYYRRY